MKTGVYIWIDWKSSTDSAQSMLHYAGKCELAEGIEAVRKIDEKQLVENRPKWLRDCTQIQITLQEISTGKTLYRRVLSKKQ